MEQKWSYGQDCSQRHWRKMTVENQPQIKVPSSRTWGGGLAKASTIACNAYSRLPMLISIYFCPTQSKGRLAQAGLLNFASTRVRWHRIFCLWQHLMWIWEFSLGKTSGKLGGKPKERKHLKHQLLYSGQNWRENISWACWHHEPRMDWVTQQSL